MLRIDITVPGDVGVGSYIAVKVKISGWDIYLFMYTTYNLSHRDLQGQLHCRSLDVGTFHIIVQYNSMGTYITQVCDYAFEDLSSGLSLCNDWQQGTHYFFPLLSALTQPVLSSEDGRGAQTLRPVCHGTVEQLGKWVSVSVIWLNYIQIQLVHVLCIGVLHVSLRCQRQNAIHLVYSEMCSWQRNPPNIHPV